VVFLAKWLGIGPWEVEAHPEWFADLDVVASAYTQAETGAKVTNRS
jgi:hypothetical protein